MWDSTSVQNIPFFIIPSIKVHRTDRIFFNFNHMYFWLIIIRTLWIKGRRVTGTELSRKNIFLVSKCKDVYLRFLFSCQ